MCCKGVKKFLSENVNKISPERWYNLLMNLRYLLLLFNLITVVVYLILLVLTFHLLAEPFPASMLRHAIENIPIPSAIYAFNSNFKVKPGAVNVYVLEIMKPIYDSLITLSSVMVISSFLGFVAVWVCYRFILIVYVFVKAGTAITIVSIQPHLKELLIDGSQIKLRKSFQRFQSDFSSEVDSLVWTGIQGALQCCGINGPKDYKEHVNFPTAGFLMRQYYHRKQRPISCCVHNEGNKAWAVLWCKDEELQGCFESMENKYEAFVHYSMPFFSTMCSIHLADLVVALVIFFLTFLQALPTPHRYGLTKRTIIVQQTYPVPPIDYGYDPRYEEEYYGEQNEEYYDENYYDDNNEPPPPSQGQPANKPTNPPVK